MATWSGRLRRRLLGLAPDEPTFARRGFRARDEGSQARLERSGRTFLDGYHIAIEEDDLEAVGRRLSAVELEYQGFAFEGAAMGLALLDHLLPWRGQRWEAFLAGPGAPHVYMVHVGAGWAIARLPWLRRDVGRPLARLHPRLRWLAIDGYGFHEGFFHWQRSVIAQAVPRRLVGYAHRAFDQGLGRSLWFVNGADVARIPVTVGAFAKSRRADLWSGVGLACAYAGGTERVAVEILRKAAGPHAPCLAQGAAFAAKARQRAGNPAPHTDLACEVLCEMSGDEAARVTDLALEGLSPDGPEPAYETWRRRIQARFAREAVRV